MGKKILLIPLLLLSACKVVPYRQSEADMEKECRQEQKMQDSTETAHHKKGGPTLSSCI